MKHSWLLAVLSAVALVNPLASAQDEASERIQAFCVDFNWGPGGPNGFAAPGLFAGASPAEHVAWYRSLGANTIQTFCVSCCGYAWYPSEVAPVQPGMKGDFLGEVVRLGHAEGMRVMGYFCVGANTHWGETHPEENYGTPSAIHLPLTTEYLDSLCACIEEALARTGIDGFMLDWFYSPPLLMGDDQVRWLECEKMMYTELFGEVFPGEAQMTAESTLDFQRRAVARAWQRIHETAKSTNPECLIWLSCFDLEHPQMLGQPMFREIDWIMNETPTPEKLDAVQGRIGAHTKVIQCVVGGSTQYDASRVIDDPRYADVGLYGFAPWPDEATTLPPVKPEGATHLTIARNIEQVRRAFGGVNPAGKPTPEQIAWHELELEMFVCLDPCTWQDREYDDHSTPLAEIDPSELDADQWCQAALSFGAKQILFVAKHTGGFCWWQTETSEYSIRGTPYKNGKGDVLGELAEACKRHRLKLAIYVYPGDDQWGAPMGSGGRTRDPAKQEAYNEVFRQQLTEVLSNYGPVSEVWFDGSCVIEVGDILERHAPGAMVFQGPHATLRWPGSETGFAPDPAWQTVSALDAATGVSTARHSDPDAAVWLPMEMDTTLLDHKWFWGRDTDSMLKSSEQLIEIYYRSVGRGGVLLLNSTPDTRGLIPDSHLARYRELGAEIERRFGESLAEVGGSGDLLELAFPQPTSVNHTVLMEDITNGHTIRAYAIEGRVDGEWTLLAEGTSVGHKKIDYFPDTSVSRLRLRVTDSRGTPIVRRLAAFDVDLAAGAYPELRAPLTIHIVRASSVWEANPGYEGSKAVDGDEGTRWAPRDAEPSWLEIYFGEPQRIGALRLREGWDRIRRYELFGKQGEEWISLHRGEALGGELFLEFEPLETVGLRLAILETSDVPTIYEWQVFRALEGAVKPWREVASWDGALVGAEWTELTFDLSAHIPRVGQYEVEFRRTGGEGKLELEGATLLLEGLEAPQALSTRLDRPNTFHVSRSQVVTSDRKRHTELRVRARLFGEARGVVRIQ